ncbi:hypothetical protein VTN77DRAFT_5502 [Rasamsonia byssochlamydoides]|uniref:uncharacterized protein n=1 Tax=Rasamsonia byssochlamydoides TaxID=89139 RepID=UPI003742E2FC
MSNNPNEYNDPNRQGQYPPQQWNASQPEENSNSAAPHPPSSQYPYPPSSYPPPPTSEQERAGAPAYQYPPPTQPYPPPPSSNMAAIHPQMQGPQDPYRLPPPPGAYQRPPEMYPQPPPPPQVVYQAAAPRQRTAIACRYCRRRKIRCSGFESSQDGRCSNCIRFNQECMFTPVSSQAQAFVPAHAAYPHLRNQAGRGRGAYPGDGVMLYGAHGQPLPPQQQPPPETTLPPPQGMYQHPYGRPPHLDNQGAPPPLAHPPMSQDQRQPGARRGSGSGFEYPDPTNLAPVSPAVSTPSYSTPYYPGPQHDRRPSPQSGYPYDRGTPHTSSPYPPMQSGHGTPPPTSTPSASRGGLNVRDMLNPGDQGQSGRSSTDSDMLNALNRRV